MERFKSKRNLTDQQCLHLATTLYKLNGVCNLFNPFPNDKYHSSKLKEFADDNLKFDGNSRKFSKKVENGVGKGEIARNEQFLLFPQCFQRTYTVDT